MRSSWVHLVAAAVSTPVDWTDAEDLRRADPNRAQPVRLPALESASLSIPLVFPPSILGEAFANYQHIAKPTIRRWVQRMLDRGVYDTEHALWKAATDAASDELDRPLTEHERLVLTRVVKEMHANYETLRVHRLGSVFAR